MHYGPWRVWQVWRSIPWSGIPWLGVQSGPCSGLQEGVTPLLHHCRRRRSRCEAEQAPQCCTSVNLAKPSRQNLNSMTELFKGSRNRSWLLFPSFYSLVAAATVNTINSYLFASACPQYSLFAGASPGRFPPHLSDLECALAPCLCRVSKLSEQTASETRHPST